MAGFQWGTALGAGAKAALSTYESLENIDQQRADSERRDRALKIQEDANARAAASHARQERAAAKAEADAARLQAILSGGGGAIQMDEPAPATGGAPAAVAPQARQAIPADTVPGGGIPQPEQPPQAAIPVQQPQQPRGGRSRADLQQRLIEGGFLKEAAQLGQIMNQDAEREIRRIQAAKSAFDLKTSEIDFAQKQVSQRIAGVSHILSGMTEGVNAPLHTNREGSRARAVLEEMRSVYGLIPDGRRLDVKYHDDGAATLRFVDEETGRLISEQKITTYGQLQEAVSMYGNMADPVTYNQYITVAENKRREAELEELNLRDRGATTALNEEKVRMAVAEGEIRRNINELIRDPAANEAELLRLADMLATYDPKVLETVKITDPVTGEERKITVNKMVERIRAMLPKEVIEVQGSNGKPTTYSYQQAAAKYVESLPELLQQSGNNIQLVLAGLQQRHDKMFNRGAFERHVLPMLQPRLQALVQQAQQTQPAAQQGALQAISTGPDSADPRFIARQRERTEALRARYQQEQAEREAARLERLERLDQAIQRQRDRHLQQDRRMPWEHSRGGR